MKLMIERNALTPWMRNLPHNWKVTRLDAVAHVLFSNVDKHTKEGELPIRLCNYVDVYKNEKITRSLDFMEATANPREVDKFQIHQGDVLATKDSEEWNDIAIPALVTEDLPGVLCGYHLALIRPRSKRIIGPFLAWAHASKQIRAQYEAKAVGVTRFGLSQYIFKAACVPLPPVSEQNLIAAYLDAGCAVVDKAVTIKRRQIEVLNSMRESLVESTVTKGVNESVSTRFVEGDWIHEIPKHWNFCRIKRVMSHIDYGISESTEDFGQYPVIKMGNIQSGEIDFQDLEFVDNISDDLLLKPGDVLYNRTNSADQVGKAAIFRGSGDELATFASYLVRLRTNHRADPYFLNYLVGCKGFLSFVRKLAIPSVQQSNLNPTRYCQIFIPLPPIEEQREIASHLNKKLADWAYVVTDLKAQIEWLIKYRKSLIHECVTGQRRITVEDLNKVKMHG